MLSMLQLHWRLVLLLLLLLLPHWCLQYLQQLCLRLLLLPLPWWLQCMRQLRWHLLLLLLLLGCCCSWPERIIRNNSSSSLWSETHPSVQATLIWQFIPQAACMKQHLLHNTSACTAFSDQILRLKPVC
jgi:hypothetical protein